MPAALQSLGSTTSNMSLSELQLQYNAQRMAVVDELRRAKEEAEQVGLGAAPAGRGGGGA
jgi:hypothetical protein